MGEALADQPARIAREAAPAVEALGQRVVALDLEVQRVEAPLRARALHLVEQRARDAAPTRGRAHVEFVDQPVPTVPLDAEAEDENEVALQLAVARRHQDAAERRIAEDLPERAARGRLVERVGGLRVEGADQFQERRRVGRRGEA